MNLNHSFQANFQRLGNMIVILSLLGNQAGLNGPRARAQANSNGDSTASNPQVTQRIEDCSSFFDEGNIFLPLIMKNYDSSAPAAAASEKRSQAAQVNASLKAGFKATPYKGIAPLNVFFANSSQGQVNDYEWDFGDSTSSSEKTPAHIYTAPGTYSVSLKASGPEGSDTLICQSYIEVLPDNQAPIVTINTPTEDSVAGSAQVQVTGMVTDDGMIANVLVNGVAATLTGNQFSAQVTLEEGNQVIEASAEDDQGALGFASRIIRVDGEGPMVGIQQPPDRQAVYTTQPNVVINYTDFYAEVNPSSLNAQLRAENGSVTDVTANLSVGAESASGTLNGLVAGMVYTLSVSIADMLGNIGSDTNTFYVPTGLGTITPPEIADGTGWISGQVYDSSTCNEYLTTCQGLRGVHVTLAPMDHETRELITDTLGISITTLISGPDGFYAFPVNATGVYAVRFEKDGYTYGQRETAVVRGKSTAVNALYLTPLDTAVSDCDNAGCHHVSADGMLIVDIPPDAIPNGENIQVTATNFDQVEFLPSGDLPPNTEETYAFNLGGDSEASFLRPVTVTMQNYRGFDPGTKIPLGYWNQETLQWEHVGTGLVDETGNWVTMAVEHFSNYDCNLIRRTPNFSGRLNDMTQTDNPCSDAESGCLINVKSGNVREWIDLPSVNVLGEPVAPTLAYNTNRADPSEVIDLRLDLFFDNQNISLRDQIQFELYIEGQKTDQFTFDADPDGNGEVGRYRYLWDGRNMLGEQLPPGVYEYAIKLSVSYDGEYCYVQLGRFGSSLGCLPAYGYTPFTATRDYWIRGTITLNTQMDSTMGQGWVLADQQRLVEDEAGRLLVSNGDQQDQYYFEVVDQLSGLRQSRIDLDQPPVVGPAAEINIVPQPASGTPVSGTISVDTTWTKANSPYIITGENVIVADGATLTIEPGVSVLLDQYLNLFVDGELQAVGTASEPITMTAYSDGTYENWDQYSMYDPASDKVITYVDAVAIDSHNNAWFAGTISGYAETLRVDRLRADLQTWDSYMFPAVLGASLIHEIAIDSQERIWFASNGGAAMLAADGQTWSTYQPPTITGNHVYAVAIAPNGDIWFGTEAGADQFTPSTGTWNNYHAGIELPAGVVRAIDFDAAGNTWLGTEVGLCQLIVNGSVSCPLYNSQDVIDLAFDQQNNAWATFSNAGVGRLSLGSSLWTTYTVATGDLASDNVSSIAVDNYNRKWVGYANQGISILSGDNYFWRHETAPKLSSNSVTDIAIGPDGAVWVGSYVTSDGENITRILRGAYPGGTISGGYWGMLQIGGGFDLSDSDDSQLRYVQIEAAGINHNPGLYLYQSAPSLENLTILGSGGYGLYAQDSTGFTLDTATIDSNEGDGIYIQGGSGEYVLTQVTARANNGHGLHIDSSFSGNLTVDGAALADNQGYGLFTDPGNASLNLQNSAIENNTAAARLPANTHLQANTWVANQNQQIEFNAGTLLTNTSWQAGVEYYLVRGTILVPDGITLTIPMSATVLFVNGAGLNVEGALSAVGSLDAPIYFGPLSSWGSSSWAGIALGGGSLADSDGSRLAYVTIERASVGLSLFQSRPMLHHLNLVRNNYGLQVSDSAGAAIHDSNLIKNQSYAVYNTTPAAVIDASGNYWNATIGPYHPSINPISQGDRVSNGVTFQQFLGGPVLMPGLERKLVRRTATDRTYLDYDEDSGAYTRYELDGTAIHFDAEGRHTATVEPDGRQTVYSYNPDGSLASMGIIAPNETSPRWVWNFAYVSGKLHTISDPNKRVTTFDVDKHGQLAGVAFPDGSQRRFYYDPRGLLTQQVDRAGEVTRYAYDDYGRLSQHTAPQRSVYDPESGQSALGRETSTFTPSDTAYPLINASPVGNPGAPAPAVPKSAELVDGVAYGQGGLSGYTNQWGNWVETSDALEHTTSYIRNGGNNLVKQVLPSGDCTKKTYDTLGNLLTVTEMVATQCNLPPYQLDPMQIRVTSYTYEPRFNHIRTQTDASGKTTTYTYDYELGQGEAGNLARVEYPPVLDEHGTWITPTTQNTYNTWGLLETQTNAHGTVTRYIYTQGTPDETAGGSHPLFAAGVSPVPGLLTQIVEDDGGLEMSTTYKNFDANGNTQMVVFPGGSSRIYTFDTRGNLLSETDALGIVTRYAYDERGYLIQRVDDYTADGTTGRNQITEYTYDADERLISQRTQLGTQVIQTQQAYDINGRSAGQMDSNGNWSQTLYDAANQRVGMVNSLEQMTAFTYDPNGRQETMQNADSTLVHTQYNGLGQVTRSVANWKDGIFDPNQPDQDIETRYQYDILGHTTIVTDTLGRMTRTFYNPGGRLQGEIANWQAGVGLADCAGLPTQRDQNLCTQYAYDVIGQTTIVTDTLGRMTRTFYDTLGRTQAVVLNWNPATLDTPDDCILSPTNESDENFCILSGYDQAGNQSTLTNALGQTTLTVYDAARRPVLSVSNWNSTPIASAADCTFPPVQPDVNGCTVTTYNRQGLRSAVKDPLGHVTEFGYDNLGRLTTTTRHLGNTPLTTTSSYDAQGNRISQTDALGRTTLFVYDPLNRLVETISPTGITTSQAYDGMGRIATTSDGLGHQTIQQYDDLGRLASSTDATGNMTSFSYDGLGNQVAVTDANLMRTSYAYDGLNHLVRITQNDTGGVPTSDSNLVMQYGLDVAGRRLTVTDARGLVTQQVTYDGMDRPTLVQDGLSHPTTIHYNALGQRLRVIDANDATVQYHYDRQNRLTTVTALGVSVQYAYDALGNRIAMTDSHGMTTYTYDELSRLISVTNPQSGSVGYEYDQVGNRTQLIYPDDKTVTYAYDADNRLASATDWHNRQTNYTYDAAGRLVTTHLPNGVLTTQIYDNANRLLALKHTASGGTVTLAAYQYTLDDLGNRTQATETFSQTARTITYTYDDLYRLKSASYSSGASYAYAYNAAGDRLQQTVNGNITNYQYDAASRLTSINGQATSWDSNGNLLTANDTTNTWDTLNRLTETSQGGHTLQPLYNGNGDRVGHVLDGQTTYFALNVVGQPEVLQTSSGETYLHLPGVIVTENSAGAMRYLLADGLGSVRQAVNENGQVTAYSEYDPYGQPLPSANLNVGAYGFTGEWWQAEVGLLHLRARWYAPGMGIFLSRDPLDSEPPYAYVHNNPINFTDPTGRYTECEWNYRYKRNEAIDGILVGASISFSFASMIVAYRGKEAVWDFVTGEKQVFDVSINTDEAVGITGFTSSAIGVAVDDYLGGVYGFTERPPGGCPIDPNSGLCLVGEYSGVFVIGQFNVGVPLGFASLGVTGADFSSVFSGTLVPNYHIFGYTIGAEASFGVGAEEGLGVGLSTLALLYTPITDSYKEFKNPNEMAQDFGTLFGIGYGLTLLLHFSE